MKSIKSMMMGGAIVFSLSMMFTSCEGALDDLLGEWSRPTPGNNTPSGGGSSTINATAITLSQTMKVIKLGGDALTINVTFTPSDATDKSVTWTSKDPNIATVDNGVVTAKSLGITTITAKSGDLTATCEVFVGTEVDDVSTRNPIQDYDILAGTQNSAFITIPNGYHVAFNGVNTNRTVICSGDATIYLTDGSVNDVTVTAAGDAGIRAGGAGTTLTINAETEGTGQLIAKSSLFCAGIGTGTSTTSDLQCGDITINGGTVTATGSSGGAGIGTGTSASSNQICGNITIGTGITSVKATRGGSISSSIGEGSKSSTASQSCGKIKFGTAQVFDGSSWDASINFNVDGNYGPFGGLNLAITTTTNPNDTWTLTPAP